MDSTLEYFEQYRQKRMELERLKKSYTSILGQMDDIRKKSDKLSNEISSMQSIITYMIDHGMDPVEAKLKTESYERVVNLWSESMITNTGSISITGALSGLSTMTGATGAVGSNHYPTVSYPTSYPPSGIGQSYVSASSIGQTYHGTIPNSSSSNYHNQKS